ncbi:beta-propeller fold lactonase family protein [Herbiconiux sp. VKM Ac-1786]|uniref:lactonase family protein n=1 Tax=Herbiconiux sp. VKM Ac-1786 TaxID=2783824 RepID=UPI00188B51E6|nr:beta-propeller fold lactonase family protein [Herbiconiux sp. VKM Ac-1786]MBF4572427.1 beta-propeller fold lactonase family protein [Herbiconiux sp. VKM Ac-1786]
MTDDHAAPSLLWAGSYTAEFPGRGLGLTPLTRDDSGGHAVAGTAHTTASPSFAVAHPSLAVLYTADESRSTVSAFAVSGAALTSLGSQPAGPAVCHVAVDPDGGFVAATCWGDGRVLIYPLDGAGRLGSPVLAAAASDPYAASRPAVDGHTGAAPRSQAHMTLVLDPLADGSRMLATTDLGYDLVRFWAWSPPAVAAGTASASDADAPGAAAAPTAGPAAPDAAGPGSLSPLGEVVLPLGSGPRHLVRTPDGRLLVVTEYSVEVAVLEPTTAPGAPYRLAGMVPVLADGPTPGDSAAEIALSPDARHVYVGVRGSDLLATLELDGPALRPVAQVPSGGRTPRHHLIDGDRLHVAHQDSDELTTHALSPDGLPTQIVARLPLGSPTVLAAEPARA